MQISENEVLNDETAESEGYICFADFEFTCGNNRARSKCELLSVGIVICDYDYRLKEKFYSTCKPVGDSVLTKECIDLTHLTQEEIDNSPDSNDVIGEALKLLDRYNIMDVEVWGNYDAIAIRNDSKMHSKNGLESGNLLDFSKYIFDIQQEVTDKLELPEAVNIEELATAFGYVPQEGSFHNALNDAEALYVINRCVDTTDFMNNINFMELKQKRIERREAERKRIDEERRKVAFSVPLSEREADYYSRLDKNEEDKRHFIFLRSRFISALKKHPDEKYFYLLVYNNKTNVKVIPQSSEKINLSSALRYKKFLRTDYSKIILGECLNRKKALMP